MKDLQRALGALLFFAFIGGLLGPAIFESAVDTKLRNRGEPGIIDPSFPSLPSTGSQRTQQSTTQQGSQRRENQSSSQVPNLGSTPSGVTSRQQPGDVPIFTPAQGTFYIEFGNYSKDVAERLKEKSALINVVKAPNGKAIMIFSSETEAKNMAATLRDIGGMRVGKVKPWW